MIKYTVLPLAVTDKAAFTEASREELRVLLALIESGGSFTSVDELALSASVSLSRARSALVLWEEEGAIRSSDSIPNAPTTVTEEFESRIELGKITDRTSSAVAREIRDNDLADLIAECAQMTEKKR